MFSVAEYSPDAVYRGLIAGGASEETAVKVSLAIKDGISWFI